MLPWRDRLTIRIREAASVLSVSERHLRRLIHAGHLPVIRSEGAILIRSTDLIRYIDGKMNDRPGGKPLAPRAAKALGSLRRKLEAG
jgi:excisionase family DNA binding protein